MSEASRKIEEKSARQLLRETRKLQKKFKKKLEENEQKELQEAIDALTEALDKQEKLSLLTKDLEQLATRLFAPYRKSVTREYVESILIAVAVALLYSGLDKFVFLYTCERRVTTTQYLRVM